MGMKYSTIAGGDVTEETYPVLPQQGKLEKEKQSLLDVLKDIKELNDSDADELRDAIISALEKKRGLDVSKRSDLVPGISTEKGFVILPEWGENREDHYLEKAMAVMAKDLGYRVFPIPYTGRLKELTKDEEEFAIGISFVTLDQNRNFNMTEKSDSYENGRTFARSQQIIGLFDTNEKLGIEALKKNHRFFGNNPGETKGSKSVRVPVTYLAKTSGRLFAEEEWSEHLRLVLNSLLRKYHTVLPDSVRSQIIENNLISHSEVIQTYCTREITLVPIQGRRKFQSVKEKRVPHKPRSNVLLLKEEQQFLNGIVDSLFIDGVPTTSGKFIEFIMRHGFKQYLNHMKAVSSKRAEFLQKFASLTSKRLNEVRRLSESHKTKRKRDVTSTDITSALARRDTPANKFASEILSLDPSCSLFLGAYRVNAPGTSSIDYGMTSLRIKELIDKVIPYDSLLNKGKEPITRSGNIPTVNTEEVGEPKGPPAPHIFSYP